MTRVNHAMSSSNSGSSQSSSGTFSSTSQSSHTDSSGRTVSESITSDPSGTTIHRTTQEPGRPPQTETIWIPVGGLPQRIGGSAGAAEAGTNEDVTSAGAEEMEADKAYGEKMEDEYAKREGGA